MNIKHKLGILAAIIVAGFAAAGPIKTWSAGEYITSTDLNANFSHIHNTMVGAHGARLVNADVSASAAIDHSKLATPQVLPKAWATVTTTCSSSPCSLGEDIGVSTITRSATGIYSVNLSPARTDSDYGVLVSSGTVDIWCSYASKTTTTVAVQCHSATTVDADAAFSILIMDAE